MYNVDGYTDWCNEHGYDSTVADYMEEYNEYLRSLWEDAD